MSHSFEDLGHETPVADLHALHDLAERAGGGRHDSAALEVGSWTGRTALVLAAHFEQVFCVDHLFGNAEDRLGELARAHGQAAIFAALCRNLGPLLCTRVFPCVGTSRAWGAAWTRPLDLVFLDGDHRYRSVVEDIDSWSRHLRPGGLIVFHDHGAFDGVTRAVDERFPDRKLAGATIAYAEVP